MKTVLTVILAAGALTILATATVVFIRSSKRRSTMTPQEVQNAVTSSLEEIVSRKKDVRNAVVAVDSPLLGISIRHAAGEAAPGIPMTPQTPFHSASVGKLHTAAATIALIESGAVGWDDPIGNVMDTETYRGMLVVDGEELLHNLTIRQMLSHRTGLADHFGDKTMDGAPNTMESLLNEPNHVWTINSRLAYVRDHYKPIGRPDEKFHYADTNYDLLGLTAEAVTEKKFEEIRRELILNPAGMSESAAWPPEDTDGNRIAAKGGIAEVRLEDVEVSRFASISIDGPGGGLAVTIDDQIRFIRALIEGTKLPQLESFMPPNGEWNRFVKGIDYGYGLMAIRPEKLSPFMKDFPDLYGHSGITGSYLYYVPEYDAVIAGTFNTSTWGRSRHVIFILEILGYLKRIAESEF